MASVASDANARLCKAAESGDVTAVQRLIAAGADPNANEGGTGGTPLQWAARGGHLAAAAALLKAGARVNGAHSLGYTPILFASQFGHSAVIDALIAAGGDVHQVRKDGDTAVGIAAMYGHLDTVRLLLEAGAKADVRNNNGTLPVDVVRGPCALCHALIDATRALCSLDCRYAPTRLLSRWRTRQA
jgi:ankyrin repeat protein